MNLQINLGFERMKVELVEYEGTEWDYFGDFRRFHSRVVSESLPNPPNPERLHICVLYIPIVTPFPQSIPLHSPLHVT